MVYLKYVENVIPLSKLKGLLFLFSLPLLSILFLKTKRNDLARPVMGTIFLVLKIKLGHNAKGDCGACGREIYNKMFGRARDSRANGAWLSKLTE